MEEVRRGCIARRGVGRGGMCLIVRDPYCHQLPCQTGVGASSLSQYAPAALPYFRRRHVANTARSYSAQAPQNASSIFACCQKLETA